MRFLLMDLWFVGALFKLCKKVVLALFLLVQMNFRFD